MDPSGVLSLDLLRVTSLLPRTPVSHQSTHHWSILARRPL